MGERRSSRARWRVWVFDLRATWAKNLRRLGLSTSNDQSATPAARKQVSLSRLSRIARGELELASRRSQVNGVAPRVGSGGSKESSHRLQSAVSIGVSCR